MEKRDYIEKAGRQLASAVNRVRRLQDSDGRIRSQAPLAAREMKRIGLLAAELESAIAGTNVAQAFALDVANWEKRGLETRPDFSATRDAFRPPVQGAYGFFVGPTLATNGPAPTGHFLEFFVVYRDEPQAARSTQARHPHPRSECQSTRLIVGSKGFLEGNCIVFFPENVATPEPPKDQRYAIFFFNKFREIYTRVTMPLAARLFGEAETLDAASQWSSFRLDPETCYAARCVWGYLHDCFHYGGPRPFNENIRLKTDWHVGLLEEIKCDCQVALLACRGEVDFSEDLLQFVLFERMLRYPTHPSADRNFDAATGVLLFEWLFERGAIRAGTRSPLSIHRNALEQALDDLVKQIVSLEHLPDSAYSRQAKETVREFLPLGSQAEGFSFPKRYANLVRPTPERKTIHFGRRNLF